MAMCTTFLQGCRTLETLRCFVGVPFQPLSAAMMSAAALAVLLMASTASVHAVPAATCQAVVSLSTPWASPQGDATLTSLNLNIVNLGSALIPVPWTLTLFSPAYGTIRQVTFLLLNYQTDRDSAQVPHAPQSPP